MPTRPAAKKPAKKPAKTTVVAPPTTAKPAPPAKARRPAPGAAAESLEGARGFRVLKDEIVRADKRGRLTVGDGAAEKQFRILINSDGQILLDPVVVLPAREAWLYRNPQALASVLQGLREAADGEVHDLGSFAGDA